MGGEKTKGGGPEKSGLGSPPRGRGKVGHSVISTISSGITPAWAGKSLGICACFPLVQDHPRVGGEKPMSLRAALAPPGSPPRGRGKEEDESFAAHAARITPAWAGKRSLRLRHRCPGRDHPRVGGEKTATTNHEMIILGSPPRGRGKAIRVVQSSRCLRITPAWAGKSFPGILCLILLSDHPRVGGEKLPFSSSALVGLGSPPRGRGKDKQK